MVNNALTVDYKDGIVDIDFYSSASTICCRFSARHIASHPRTRARPEQDPRLVETFARRLQIQERLTNQIANTLSAKVQPLGVAVVLEAAHLCMSMRGIQKQNSVAVTSAMLGVFHDDARTRMEFLELIKRPELVGSSVKVPLPGLTCVPD